MLLSLEWCDWYGLARLFRVGLKQLGGVVNVLVGALAVWNSDEMLHRLGAVKVCLAVEAGGFLEHHSAGVDALATDAAGRSRLESVGVSADNTARCGNVGLLGLHDGSPINKCRRGSTVTTPL